MLSSARCLGQCLVFLALVTTAMSGAESKAVARRESDLGAVLADKENLSTFYQLIKRYPDILLRLPSYAGVTIVAPSNKAFENIPHTALDQIWNVDKPEIVTPILSYHIIQGTLAVAGIEPGVPAVAHTLLQDPAWTSLSQGQQLLVYKQSRTDIVFVSGGGTRAQLLRGNGDIAFAGGVVQVIDNLLVPPAPLNRTLPTFGDLSLLGALHAAGVYEAFARCRNCTLFAPTTSALQAANASLTAMSRPELAAVLDYHLVPDTILASAALVNGSSLSTAGRAPDGSPRQLHVHRTGNDLYVNSARLVQADVLFANGILHLLENVLNPAADTARPDPTTDIQAPVYSGLVDTWTLTATDLPFTSALPCTHDCPVTPTATDSLPTATTRSFRTSSSRAAAAAWRPVCTAVPLPVRVGAGLGVGLGVGMMLAL